MSRKKNKRKQENVDDSSSNQQAQPKAKQLKVLNNGGIIEELTPRERQYLFSAGLHPVQLNKKKKEKKEDSSSAADFATRALGSASQSTRHGAIQRLQEFLSISAAGKGISYLEIKKLWKGMWYGLYMCDKAVVQDELSSHMAKLIWSVAGTIEADMQEANTYVQLEEQALEDHLDPNDEDDEDDVEILDVKEYNGQDFPSDDEEEDASEDDEEEEEGDDSEDEDHPEHTSVTLVCMFVKGYFETIQREWGYMDKHRLDKFYRSMRLMLSEIFQYCASREWHVGVVHMFNDTVFNQILCQEAGFNNIMKYPNGVRFHMIDIVLEELAKVSSSSSLPITTVSFLNILEPYLTIAMADSEKVVQARVIENILDKFITQYSVMSRSSNSEENNNENPTPLLDLVSVVLVAQQLFEIASNPETADRYRSSLYRMHKLYLRKMKDAAYVESESDDKVNLMMEKTLNCCPPCSQGEVCGPPSDGGEVCVGQQPADQGEVCVGELPADNDEEDPSDELKSKKKKKNKKKPSKLEIEPEEEVEQDAVVAKSKTGKLQAIDGVAKSKNSLKDVVTAQASGQDSTEMNALVVDDNLKAEGSLLKEGPGEESRSKKNKKRKKDVPNTDESTLEIDEQHKVTKPSHKSVALETRADSTNAPSVTAASEQVSTKTKKNEKKKQLEEEIVISLREQSDFLINAVKSVTKSEGKLVSSPKTTAVIVKKHQKKKDGTVVKEKQNRVKFGSVNRTKSYKASMTALQTMEHPATATREPEKPILREPKYARSSLGSKGPTKNKVNAPRGPFKNQRSSLG